MEPERRRCRHGLTDGVTIAGTAVSHSQHLCRSVDPSEIRRGDYRPVEAGTADGATEDAIEHVGEPAGTAWRVATDLGVVWLQSLAPSPPSLTEVATALGGTQRRSAARLRREAARTRAEATALRRRRSAARDGGAVELKLQGPREDHRTTAAACRGRAAER